MKKKYICPRIEVTELMSESLMQAVSIDNTGNGGSDGEKQTVIDSGNAGNDKPPHGHKTAAQGLALHEERHSPV